MVDLFAILVIFIAGIFTGLLTAVFYIAAQYQNYTEQESNHE